jgi:hypothetical protein
MNSFSSIVAPFSVAPRRTRCDNPGIGTAFKFDAERQYLTDSEFVGLSSRTAIEMRADACLSFREQQTGWSFISVLGHCGTQA